MKNKTMDGVKQNIVVTVIFWCLFFVVGMGTMLFVASRKTIVIAETGKEPGTVSVSGGDALVDRGTLFTVTSGDEEGVICIPLPKGTKAESVAMENRYMDRELWIYVQGAWPEFYQDNAGYGDLSEFGQGYYDANSDGVVLKLSMNRILEYRSTLDNEMLRIAFYDPHELYEQLVVIDSAGGGRDMGITWGGRSEKDITLQVALKLQNLTDQEHIKLYFTRLDDVDISDIQRLGLVEETGADLYIRLAVSEDGESRNAYGITGVYNATYFIPQFGSIQLADVLTRNVTISASNKAVGLLEAPQDSILQRMKVPAAEVRLGYLTNPQEGELLEEESYLEKLAEGLAKAISEVYTSEHE